MTALHAKYWVLITFRFEAYLYLRDQDNRRPGTRNSLTEVIETATLCCSETPPQTCTALIDILLSAVTDPQPGQDISVDEALEVLQTVLNKVRKYESYDVTQASRWIRCIAQLVLDKTPASDLEKSTTSPQITSRITLLFSIIDQAIILARSSRGRQNSATSDEDHDNTHIYPAEEIEWLATTLFNRAIDLYVAGRQEETRRWAGKAIECADVLAVEGRSGDGGQLSRMIRSRMDGLGTDSA